MSRGTWQGSGTWQSSGPDLAGLIVPAAVIGAVVAVVAIIMEFAVLIAAVAGTVFVLAVALLAWWKFCAEPKHIAAIEDARAVREAADAARAVQRHASALELARAGAPVICNVLDPAAIAAAFYGMQPQRQPVRVKAEIVKPEVRR